MKNQCFAYTRVSTVKQGEGVSLQAQKEAIQAFADRNGLLITNWFEEKETAAKSGRPVFSTMLKQLRAGKASGVIIHKIDRSARNFADWAKIGELSDSGIDVHFAAESIDFRSRGGRLTADIQAVIAADYIRNLRDETIKGINGRLKQGLYPWKAPIGYLDKGGGKAKTICPERGPLVRELFKLYASNEHSLWSLVDAADQLGLKTDKGKKVGKTVIENMLSNPFYIGLIHLKSRNETFQGVHEPLISKSLFEEVAQVRAGKWVKKNTRHDFTYRRILKCGDCQKSMIAERQKGHVYYRCHTKGCPSATVREDCIERQVLAKLKTLELPEIAIAELKRRIESLVQKLPLHTNGNILPMQLAQIEERKKVLVDALLDNLIDKETYEERNRQLLLEATGLREKQAQAPKMESVPDKAAKILELFKSLYFTYSLANNVEKRLIVKKLFSNRRVIGKTLN